MIVDILALFLFGFFLLPLIAFQVIKLGTLGFYRGREAFLDFKQKQLDQKCQAMSTLSQKESSYGE